VQQTSNTDDKYFFKKTGLSSTTITSAAACKPPFLNTFFGGKLLTTPRLSHDVINVLGVDDVNIIVIGEKSISTIIRIITFELELCCDDF